MMTLRQLWNRVREFFANRIAKPIATLLVKFPVILPANLLKNRRFLHVALGICGAITILCIILILQPIISSNRANEIYERMRADVILLPSVQPSPLVEAPTPTQEATPETISEPTIPTDDPDFLREVDFETLWSETNADIYAWITIPNTRIDYPILQHPSDDSYYLNYNVDGTKGYPGCIYTERINAKDFSDFNTLIYGHNMKDGSMFRGLHDFADESFFAEHPYVYVFLPDRSLKYQVFAAHLFDDRHLMYVYDFANEEIQAAYLEEVLTSTGKKTVLNKDISINAQDTIITLSTCTSDSKNRYLVQAVLIEEFETKKDRNP
ncbi:MAG: class B sortase [Clostridium sp.]|jgi:sortase B|nr:class B sortase [Clostridium sp.]